MNGIFGELLPHIPAVLVSPETIAGIRSLNEKLPAALTTGGGIECSLGGAGAVSDWQLCVNRGDGREILAGRIPANDLDRSLLEIRAWQQLRHFANQWLDRYDEKIVHIWLEFDHGRLNEPAPAPGVFFSTRLPMRPSVKIAGSGNRDPLAWVGEALEQLNGGRLPKTTRRGLRKCLEALPAGAELCYAALMLSRGGEAVRIVVQMGREDLDAYLAGIPYRGSAPEVLELASEMGPWADLRYCFDVSEAVWPKVGVECFVKSGPSGGPANWERFLGHLEERSLCLPQKRAALLAWPGQAPAFLPNEFWPCYIFRGLSHVKIAGGHGRPREAKGYLKFWRQFARDIVERLKTMDGRDQLEPVSRAEESCSDRTS